MQADINAKDFLMLQLTSFFPLAAEEKEKLHLLFTERTIKRRAYILQHGDICRHFTFVVSGCFKMYALDTSGKEHNLEFAIEGGWITDLSSFYAQQPGGVYIEAIETSTVLQIKHEDVIYLYANYPKLNSIFRIIMEHKYIALQNRVLQSISATTEERYQQFLADYPSLSSRLPNTQIASYLGITPEFLSQIRRNRVHKNG